MNGEDTTETAAAATEDATGRPTNLADLLAELVPPPEPEPISLMPQTWGWPVLALLLLAGAVFLFWTLQRRHRAEAYRRVALADLQAAGSDAEAVAVVLRRTALTAFPRTDVASLSGPAWLGFLGQTCPEAAFSGAAAEALVRGPYASGDPLPEASVKLVRQWITHHSRAVTS